MVIISTSSFDDGLTIITTTKKKRFNFFSCLGQTPAKNNFKTQIKISNNFKKFTTNITKKNLKLNKTKKKHFQQALVDDKALDLNYLNQVAVV